jgi:hypothetical protein
MATEKSSAGYSAAHPPAERDHPHACLDGFVYLGFIAIDEETRDEVEHIERLPCRRCAEGE